MYYYLYIIILDTYLNFFKIIYQVPVLSVHLKNQMWLLSQAQLQEFSIPGAKGKSSLTYSVVLHTITQATSWFWHHTSTHINVLR